MLSCSLFEHICVMVMDDADGRVSGDVGGGGIRRHQKKISLNVEAELLTALREMPFVH